jgi:hypothetical protein
MAALFVKAQLHRPGCTVRSSVGVTGDVARRNPYEGSTTTLLGRLLRSGLVHREVDLEVRSNHEVEIFFG